MCLDAPTLADVLSACRENELQFVLVFYQALIMKYRLVACVVYNKTLLAQTPWISVPAFRPLISEQMMK